MKVSKKRKLETKNPMNIGKKEDSSIEVLSAEERINRKKSLYRVPTSEELTELKENENLYKNNLFKMQIEYLLKEVRPNDKKEKHINEVLHSLHKFLKDLPSQDTEHDISNDLCRPQDVCLPLPDFMLKDKVKCKFKFCRPDDVKIIGSYLIKTSIKPNVCIDVAVEIPNSCLQGRDYLNFRYHFKRASYLAWLASSLKDWEYADSISFVKEIDPYMSMILLKLKGKCRKTYSVRILISLPDNVFKLKQFSPLKNNVRSNWYNDKTANSVNEVVEYPTPHYNASILSDMLHESHLQVLHSSLNECPGMRDAICLFKLWLKQRSFKEVSCFNGFIGSMLMSYLLSIRKISPHMSSYQIFRITLNFIASSDFSKSGLSLSKNDVNFDDFHSSYDVVFVDSSGHLNLCANVDKITYDLVKYQAKLSLYVLDDSSSDGFDDLFIKCYDFLQFVDHSFTLTKLEGFYRKCIEAENNKIIDHGGNWSALVFSVVPPIIKKGLDKRINILVSKPSGKVEWSVEFPPPSIQEDKFCFGLILNPEFSNNVVIMGPSADQPDAKEFRSFWGDKSELRRFQDGSINEAVLWPCANKEEKSLVCQKIIKHLLFLHCCISESSLSYYGTDFNCILKSNHIKDDHKSKHIPGCGEEESLHLLKNFDELCKQIHALDGIPLRIKAIDGVDPSFRLTEVQVPMQYQLKSIHSGKDLLLPKLEKKTSSWPIYNAVIQFETSGKWPDDIDATQHIKASFHIKLSECIQSQLKLKAMPTPSFVDVLKNGYVFRLSVGHYREIVLCGESIVSGILKKECERKSEKLDILIVKKPLHSSLIHALNSLYHAYSLTVRLSKRWVSAQMLGDYLGEEAIELMVAFIFISPGAMATPNSHMCGFLRFLDLLGKFDFKNEPLIVNLNEEIKTEDYNFIRENFTANRSKLPSLFIASPYDKDASMWTKSNPSPQILLRLSLLANTALKLFEDDSLLSSGGINQLFRPSLREYNMVIKLNKLYVPLHYLSIDSSAFKIPPIRENLHSDSLPVIDLNPPDMYLAELRSTFSDIATFYYDRYGGLNIGVVLKQPALLPQPFKILNAQYKCLEEKRFTKSKSKTVGLSVVSNIEAIVSDFYVMGKGLVIDVIKNMP